MPKAKTRKRPAKSTNSVSITGSHNTVIQGNKTRSPKRRMSSRLTIVSIVSAIALVIGLLVDTFDLWDRIKEFVGIASPTATVALGIPTSSVISYTLKLAVDEEIYIWDQEGDPEQITANTIDDTQPAISPDGLKLLFTTVENGKWNIYLVLLNDPDKKIGLTNNSGNNEMPIWSPTGNMIAFISDRRNGNWDIYKMAADGSNQTNLTENSDSDDISPTWSADGTQIAFASARDNLSLGWEIYVLSVNNPMQIDRISNNASDDLNPSWSPNRDLIAFESNRDDETLPCQVCNWNIYVMKKDGTEQSQVTRTLSSETSPTWSLDGNHLLFCTNRDGNLEIYISNIDGTEQENLTSSSSDENYPSWYQ